MTKTRCGYIVIAGRPNVGKSTLMNRILGVHLAATTPKPQTTRNRILGIHTEAACQLIFVDTPGIHDDRNRLLNRRLNKTAISSLADGDVIVFMIEAGAWREEDAMVLRRLDDLSMPVVLVVNKIDRLERRAQLLPFLDKVGNQSGFAAIVPISALDDKSVNYLVAQLKRFIPEGPFQFSDEEMTDRSMRFVSAEMIREQLMHVLEQEIPYSLAVEIEAYKETPERVEISAVIYVEREGQKRIVIGKKGEMLKKVGTEARRRVSGLIGQPVHLGLWVKVKPGWLENPRMIERFSLDNDV